MINIPIHHTTHPYAPLPLILLLLPILLLHRLTAPTAGIIAYSAEVFSIVADKRKLVVAKGGVRESFPMKVFKMLEHIDIHEPELANIVFLVYVQLEISCTYIKYCRTPQEHNESSTSTGTYQLCINIFREARRVTACSSDWRFLSHCHILTFGSGIWF